jgi:hypothetical protein
MRQQRTASTPPTVPAVLVFTVNGHPTRTYLRQPDPEPPRRLVAEVDGHPVVWTPDRRRTSCARHPYLGGCPCVTQLGRLADPDALHGWYRGLGWRQRQQLATAPAALAATPRPRWEPPGWTWGLGHRLLLAAAALALLLVLAPLLHGR